MAEFVESTVEYAKRQRRAGRWLKSFEDLIPLVQDDDTYELMAKIREFVHFDTTIGSPIGTPDGTQFGVTVPRLDDDSPAKASFVPLFKSDRALATYFKHQDEPTYNETTQSVFIPSCKLGTEWRGILFFHEFRHAYHHVNNDYRDTYNPHWVEEVRVFEEEHAIMREVFSGFTAMINRGLKALEAMSGDVKLGKIMDDIDWSEPFPTPQSKKEEGLAHAATLLALVYADINRLFLDEDERLKRKVTFTETFYKGNE